MIFIKDFHRFYQIYEIRRNTPLSILKICILARKNRTSCESQDIRYAIDKGIVKDFYWKISASTSRIYPCCSSKVMSGRESPFCTP